MTTAIIIVFILGYALIALEGITKVNKAAIALLMSTICWALYAVGGFSVADGGFEGHEGLSAIIEHYLGDTGTTLFFLMGAMTIVEIVDQHGGFDFVTNKLITKSKKKLLWKVAFVTAFLSALLDNLTTSIVMVMILRTLVPDKAERLLYAAIVIIAANAGGALSPIGDVTTIMLWNGKQLTATGVTSQLLLPSIMAFVVPTFIMSFFLKGELEPTRTKYKLRNVPITAFRRHLIFVLGVGGLCCVPLFHLVTELPPFCGILLVLGIMWTVTEVFHRDKAEDDPSAKRVTFVLSRIDLSTILFFLGILMAVSVLNQVHILSHLGTWLNEVSDGNHYLITGAIGILSAIVDNVPLVAGSMGMYPIDAAGGDFGVDGIFWQLLAYCAGVGGSMLIIGSAAGVVVMGLEKISFMWYMKRISLIAFIGYIAGMLTYWLERLLFF
ncbi:MAG: sodium:proton antiporter NhaD [Bacteroidales bacterium]|nr:sodium:proton antiporter NhaD [Bacteroidales bacterium]